MDSSTESVPIAEWLTRLEAAIGPVAEDGADTAITTAEQRILLDIARVAAHTSERVAAPISTYLLGLAMAVRPSGDRAAELERILAAIRPDR